MQGLLKEYGLVIVTALAAKKAVKKKPSTVKKASKKVSKNLEKEL
uniref:Uncharacterized protein n=1 Tax=Marseillevirus LCMAC202 TaxID=2506606 RepID=A0A481Z0M0_9VIRU|nr:MAG: hypothetical protein LCMAC202_06960 [Marseillevirus LCMAC202]